MGFAPLGERLLPTRALEPLGVHAAEVFVLTLPGARCPLQPHVGGERRVGAPCRCEQHCRRQRGCSGRESLRRSLLPLHAWKVQHDETANGRGRGHWGQSTEAPAPGC